MAAPRSDGQVVRRLGAGGQMGHHRLAGIAPLRALTLRAWPEALGDLRGAGFPVLALTPDPGAMALADVPAVSYTHLTLPTTPYV